MAAVVPPPTHPTEDNCSSFHTIALEDLTFWLQSIQHIAHKYMQITRYFSVEKSSRDEGTQVHCLFVLSRLKKQNSIVDKSKPTHHHSHAFTRSHYLLVNDRNSSSSSSSSSSSFNKTTVKEVHTKVRL